ncbi:MAG TPA: energy transducer TonB [Longimicrobium sp.]|nr:energy transducer TonB [Longimicrobium sp.]
MSRTRLAWFFAAAAAAAVLHPAVSRAQTAQPAAAPPAAAQPADSGATLPPELANPADVDRAAAANYPSLLHDADVEGTATVRLRVNADGKVDRNSIVVTHASHELFTDPARTVAARMRFRPAEREGKPVAAEITVPVEFKLEP